MIYTADQELRVLTLWQPWASLVAWGEKRIETRPPGCTWRRYRGWIAIHASARKCDPLVTVEPCASAVYRHGNADPLPLGKILGVCRITGLSRTEDVNPHGDEMEFGDFTAGRWAIWMTDVHELAQPIEWKGAQGLPRAPQALRDFIAAQMRVAYPSAAR